MSKTEVSNAVALAVNAELSKIRAKMDNSIGYAGATAFAELGEFFGRVSEAEIIAATTPAKVGVPSKLPDGRQNPEAVRLSQDRACYRVYRDARQSFDTISAKVAAGELRGWNTILAEIREVVANLKAANADRKVEAEAAKVARTMHRDNPVAAEQFAEEYANKTREAKAAKAAEAKAERESPQGVANRIAKMLVSKLDVDEWRDVVELLPEACEAAYRKLITEPAEAEA